MSIVGRWSIQKTDSNAKKSEEKGSQGQLIVSFKTRHSEIPKCISATWTLTGNTQFYWASIMGRTIGGAVSRGVGGTQVCAELQLWAKLLTPSLALGGQVNRK